MVIISGTYTNLQTFCEMWPILWNIKSEWLEITPMHATEINVHTNRHKHSKNRARFNTITTRSTVVNDRCMKAFSKAITLQLVVCFCNFVSDKNSRTLLENFRTFFENVQNFTSFPEKFYNTKNSTTIQGIPELIATLYFWKPMMKY